jgi:hypothetical protein
VDLAGGSARVLDVVEGVVRDVVAGGVGEQDRAESGLPGGELVADVADRRYGKNSAT